MIPHADTCTCTDCIRIVAFGAIRRAAAVARRCDRSAENYSQVDHYRVAVAVSRDRADAIRHAIRAAIESEKTP
jgi:hypothetical protein